MPTFVLNCFYPARPVSLHSVCRLRGRLLPQWKFRVPSVHHREFRVNHYHYYVSVSKI